MVMVRKKKRDDSGGPTFIEELSESSHLSCILIEVIVSTFQDVGRKKEAGKLVIVYLLPIPLLLAL